MHLIVPDGGSKYRNSNAQPSFSQHFKSHSTGPTAVRHMTQLRTVLVTRFNRLRRIVGFDNEDWPEEHVENPSEK